MTIEEHQTVPATWPYTNEPPKIAFVAEAPGDQEVRQGKVLVGPSGQLLNKMLAFAKIKRTECLLTNVFDFKLPGNDVRSLCGKKSEMGKNYPYPPIAPSSYLPTKYFDSLARLREELKRAKANVIVPLGNTALWAVCERTGITKVRGTLLKSTLVPNAKVLPTYHPAAIMRTWSYYATVVSDLMKVKVQSEFPEFRRPKRWVRVDPSLGDLVTFEEQFLHTTKVIGCDIETPKRKFIGCIGFAVSPQQAIVVPFVNRRNKETYAYWPTLAEEVGAWYWVKHILEGHWIKIFQFGLFDIQWLFERVGIRPRNCIEDTMIMHHALQPEMSKKLGFLGSIYTDEVAWKLLRPRGLRTEKTDE